MEMVLLILVLAITVEGLVEYVKGAAQLFLEGEKRVLLIQLGALVASVLLCLLAGADIYTYLGVNFAAVWVGCVLTGVFASRGTNYISDLIGRLRNTGSKTPGNAP